MLQASVASEAKEREGERGEARQVLRIRRARRRLSNALTPHSRQLQRGRPAQHAHRQRLCPIRSPVQPQRGSLLAPGSPAGPAPRQLAIDSRLGADPLEGLARPRSSQAASLMRSPARQLRRGAASSGRSCTTTFLPRPSVWARTCRSSAFGARSDDLECRCGMALIVQLVRRASADGGVLCGARSLGASLASLLLSHRLPGPSFPLKSTDGVLPPARPHRSVGEQPHRWPRPRLLPNAVARLHCQDRSAVEPQRSVRGLPRLTSSLSLSLSLYEPN